MAKSKSKSKSKLKSKEKEVDWAKIGKLNKPLVDHITEPKQGIGTGKSIFDFNKPGKTGSMIGRNVITPQKPRLPVGSTADVVSYGDDNGPQAGLVQDGAGYSGPSDAHGIDQYEEYDDYEVKKMETNTSKKPQGRYADSVRDIRPPRKDSSPRKNLSRKNGRDMHSGMELLDLAFLLAIVESVEVDEKVDVAMRKLCFNELVRTGQRTEIDSKALKVYVIDGEGLYGKEIQCQAMQELAERTSQK
jgi:hypothetical protein